MKYTRSNPMHQMQVKSVSTLETVNLNIQTHIFVSLHSYLNVMSSYANLSWRGLSVEVWVLRPECRGLGVQA